MGTVTGGLQVYQTRAFETTHENRAFDALVEELRRVWGESSEPVVLIGNFLCFGSEIDAAVFRRHSITVIELKDYGGKITFSENGPWRADGVAVRGGNQPNPYKDVRRKPTRFSGGMNANAHHSALARTV